jgi:ketosteroid isomerase-like protein
MTRTESLIVKLYDALDRQDADTMAACYLPDATFTDPVFGELHGSDIAAMWAMLCKQAKDLDVGYSEVQADDITGSAEWRATYTFSPSGRRVENVVSAQFVFHNGLIASHIDRFDLWKWSRMAIGPMGTMLGWAPFFRTRLRDTARRGLRLPETGT